MKHTNDRADSILHQFRAKKVLILGDVMIDCYWHGTVKRISPEAPVPIFDFLNAENRLGGAANVALNIKSLKAEPILLSVIGDDAAAETFEKLLLNNNIAARDILRDTSRPTTLKTRLVAGTHQLLRIDNEITNDLNAEVETQFLEKIKFVLDTEPIDVIIFQDYNKGVLTPHIIEKTIVWAREKKIPTAVDPKSKNFWVYKNVTLFKPNLKEISDALGEKIIPTEPTLQSAAQQLKEKLAAETILITLSEKGLYYDTAFDKKIYPITPRRISDVSGAGDTVIAIAALCLATQTDATTLAQLANLAGGIVCEFAGVVPIDFDRLLEEFKNQFS